jgi:hypothetical protein
MSTGNDPADEKIKSWQELLGDGNSQMAKPFVKD